MTAKEEAHKKEQEANYFALALLMPREILIREIKSAKLDLTNDVALKELAKKFGVSQTALMVRMSHLNLFNLYQLSK